MSQNLYTFVAGDALKGVSSFDIECNCGTKVTFPVPIVATEDCKTCGATLNLGVIEGDKGYVLTQSAQGEDQLVWIQGSTAPDLPSLPDEKYFDIMKTMLESLPPESRTKSQHVVNILNLWADRKTGVHWYVATLDGQADPAGRPLNGLVTMKNNHNGTERVIPVAQMKNEFQLTTFERIV